MNPQSMPNLRSRLSLLACALGSLTACASSPTPDAAAPAPAAASSPLLSDIAAGLAGTAPAVASRPDERTADLPGRNPPRPGELAELPGAPGGPALLQLRLPAVDAGAAAAKALAELQCPAAAPRRAPATPAPAPATAEVLDLPDEDSVGGALAELAHQADAGDTGARAAAQDQLSDLPRRAEGAPLRVAIWGDSHLAAGFFTDTLVRLTGLPLARIQRGFISGGINRAGIRQPLRKSCVSAGWRHEPGYLSAHAATPGPGLVNLSSSEAGAWFALDLRNPDGQGEPRAPRLLYQRTAEPLRLGLSVDGAPEISVELPGGAPGPAMLELRREAPIRQLRLRLLGGTLRWHGLGFGPAPEPARPAAALQLDVFGYPGATVNGWRQADASYLGRWFAEQRYDLVALEYGTNEANDRAFDPAAYRQQLRQALARFTGMFPGAACVLIAPGDRGVLVPRAAPGRKGQAQAKTKKPRRGAVARPSVDLLRFSRLHALVGRIQHEEAAGVGCRVWSMQTAMGGLGSAYRWVRQNPPLMARDLIHFSVPGYQALAREFFKDLGWQRLEWGAP